MGKFEGSFKSRLSTEPAIVCPVGVDPPPAPGPADIWQLEAGAAASLPSAEVVRSCPVPWLEGLREQGGIARLPVSSAAGGATRLVIGHAEAVQVLRDRRFHTRVDTAEHRRFRLLAAQGLAPQVVRRYAGLIERRVEKLLAPARRTQRLDIVGDFALPLRMGNVAAAIGLPPSFEGALLHRAWEIRTTVSPTIAEQEEWLLSVAPHILARLAERRKWKQQPNDLIGHWLANHKAPGGDKEFILALGELVFDAGITDNAVPAAVLELLDRPETFAQLQAEPERIPAAVPELLRLTSPEPALGPRQVAEPVAIGGVTIAPGDRVIVSLAGANRDGRAFPDPDAFDMEREDTHLAFGFGAHRCQGLYLATMEMETALRGLLSLPGAMRLAAPRAALKWQGDLQHRHLLSLPVAWE